MSIVFEVKNLKKKYGDFLAVNDVSFSIEKGKCFGLLGPNGAGKSTTIECIEQIIDYSEGEIYFEGSLVKEKTLANFGIQFQQTSLPAKLKVKEVLEFFSSLYQDARDMSELIDLCHLTPFLNQYHDKISGGQRQRLLLAVALCHKPKLLMLDEPTTGLDPQARRNLWELVKRIKQEGTTVILTTHYMDEAFELCDEIGIMDHGKMIATGNPKFLLKETFETTVLEIPLEVISEEQVNSLSSDIHIGDRFYEVTVKDLNAALAKLAVLNLDLSGINIRQKNLEDLFIHLTGKDLRS